MKRLISFIWLLPIFIIAFSSCTFEAKFCFSCDNGICIDGDCECYPGYVGVSCSKQLTPYSITIRSIRVGGYPLLNPRGFSWDRNSGPDIYMQMFEVDGKGDPIFESRIHYDANGKPFRENMRLEIRPLHRYVIELYDADEGEEDEFMCDIIFYPYHKNNEFPPVIIAETDDGFWVELQVTYDW